MFPEKFNKLDGFFEDLCTDYGKTNVFDAAGVEAVLDVFVVCTR